MALLKQPAYRDTRATTLSGTGGGQFTDQQIQDYFKNPTTTPEKAMNDMLKYGVGTQRVADAMGDNYNNDKLMDYAKTRGVSYERKGEGELDVPGSFKQTRAGILGGAGNKSFTDQEIVSLAKSGNTPEHIMNEVVARGGSLEQVSAAMQGSGAPGDWSVGNLKAYTEGRGVDYGTVNDAPYDPVYTPLLKSTVQGSARNAPFVRANFDEEKGTVAGRLRQTLDPNNPLMARAASLAQQQAAGRGMLNSGMAASQGMAAMTDAGLQIATPDANAYNQFELSNAQNENQSNQFNAGEGNKMSMFNAGSLNDMRKTQMGIDKDYGLADRATSDLKLKLNNDRDIKNLDVDSKFAIQELLAGQEAQSNYDSLVQSYMGELAKIHASDASAEVKAQRKDEYLNLINNAAVLNKYFDAEGIDLDFSSGRSGTGDAAPAVELNNGPAQRPQAGTVETQTQAQVLAERGKIAPGTWDDTANLINANGSRLSQLDTRMLNLANKTMGTDIDPTRMVTQEEMKAKMQETRHDSSAFMRWRNTLEAINPPNPLKGTPQVFLWPA